MFDTTKLKQHVKKYDVIYGYGVTMVAITTGTLYYAKQNSKKYAGFVDGLAEESTKDHAVYREMIQQQTQLIMQKLSEPDPQK